MVLLTIRNESEVDLMAVLSQLTALHWKVKPIKPGEIAEFNCGRVWFTVSVNGYDENMLPTKAGTACRHCGIVGCVVVFYCAAVVALCVTGAISRATSRWSKTNRTINVKGCYKNGIYADGKVIVVKGVTRPDGVYQLYIDRYEWLNSKGSCKIKDFEQKKVANIQPVTASANDDNDIKKHSLI